MIQTNRSSSGESLVSVNALTQIERGLILRTRQFRAAEHPRMWFSSDLTYLGVFKEAFDAEYGGATVVFGIS